MLDFEIKEDLSEALNCVESALDAMDEIQDHDVKINKCYNLLLDAHEQIRVLYDK